MNVMYIFGNRFVVSSNLKQCVMTHTGEKLHECAYVGRDSWGLKQHMLIHTGEKPHECDVFGNRFAASSNLKQRMMTHTGEKLHECTLGKLHYSSVGGGATSSGNPYNSRESPYLRKRYFTCPFFTQGFRKIED